MSNELFDQDDKAILVKGEMKIKSNIENLFDLAYTLVDLQSIYGSLYHVMLDKESNAVEYSTTRRFNKQYKDLFKLERFYSGSVGLEFALGIISTLIGEFLKKSIWEDSRNPRIDITYNNCIIINVNDNIDKRVINSYCKDNKRLETKEDIEAFTKEFFKDVDITPGRHERNVENFLRQLEKRGYIEKNETYNSKAVKVVARNISRFEARV